ncbi:MAG: TonB-dependent receptor [Betaproteobacteria bacterium]|nr:MAG: TonB-dependent receptor [Betaproteobacteria bacterium]
MSVAFQDARDVLTGVRLTNSPAAITNASLTTRSHRGWYSTVATRYETGRRTLEGPVTPPFARSDLNVGFAAASRAVPRWLRETDASVRISNLFDRTYFTPGGIEHRQAAIAQPGRTLMVRFDSRF